MRKMKDMRGSHVSAIRTAVFKTLGLQLTSNKRKNSRDILGWKQSKEVKDGYHKLFTENTIEDITSSAFPSLSDADDQRFSDMYIYTASVCDIILNPDCPTLEVSKKVIELRLKKFRVFIEFIVVILKLILLIKVKIRKPLIKTVKLSLAIQNRSYEKNRPIFLAKRNLPMAMMMKNNNNSKT